MDTAYSLAVLQEEVADPLRRRDFRLIDAGSSSKLVPRGPQPLPLPPWIDKQSFLPYPDKMMHQSPMEDTFVPHFSRLCIDGTS